MPGRSLLRAAGFSLLRKQKSRSPAIDAGVPRLLCSSRPRKARRAQSAANCSAPREGWRRPATLSLRHRSRAPYRRARRPCPRASVGRPPDRLTASEIRTELLLKRGALVGAEPSHAAGLGNAEPLHDLLGADLADAGQGLQERRDLHLANHVVGGTVLDDFGQGHRAALEAILNLGTFLARYRCLLQGLGALFGREGRKSHSGSPRVSFVKKGGREGKLASQAPFRQREPPFMSSQIQIYYSTPMYFYLT